MIAFAATLLTIIIMCIVYLNCFVLSFYALFIQWLQKSWKETESELCRFSNKKENRNRYCGIYQYQNAISFHPFISLSNEYFIRLVGFNSVFSFIEYCLHYKGWYRLFLFLFFFLLLLYGKGLLWPS